MTVRVHVADLIADQLAVAHADTRATLAAVARRAEGASREDLLLAAIALLRDQAAHIAGLENELGDLRDEAERLEDERTEIEEALTALVRDLRDRHVGPPTEHPGT